MEPGRPRWSPSTPSSGGARFAGARPASAACCCQRRAGVRASTRRESVPRFVAEAIEGIVAVMAGEARDLRDVPLDERGIDDFRRAVYAATRDIPAGTTRSYGEVARAIGGRTGSGRRDGARSQPVPDHRSVPPRRRGERGTHRVLGTGRPRHEAPDARARRRPGLRPAGPLRLTRTCFGASARGRHGARRQAAG